MKNEFMNYSQHNKWTQPYKKSNKKYINAKMLTIVMNVYNYVRVAQIFLRKEIAMRIEVNCELKQGGLPRRH